MALARLITRTPEFAQQLRHSLESAGYAVEFASPEEIPAATADLEVNLDDPSSASSYLVTADGREISFGYDPVEREFVLAPVWRKLRAALYPLVERFRRPQPLASESEHQTPAQAFTDAPVEAPSPLSAAEPEKERIAFAPPPVAEALPQSLYLSRPVEPEVAEEPMRFSGVDYFDGLGARRSGPEPEVPAAFSAPLPETQPIAPSAEPTLAPTPWLVQAALRGDALRRRVAERLSAARSATANTARRWQSYDQAWLRAVPTAAIITLAFLLGWAVANSGESKPPVRPVGEAQVNEAAVLPAAVAPAPARVKAAVAKPARKPQAARVEGDEDDEEAADVVIRHYPKHYPSKGVQAANQKSVRRYSDLN